MSAFRASSTDRFHKLVPAALPGVSDTLEQFSSKKNRSTKRIEGDCRSAVEGDDAGFAVELNTGSVSPILMRKFRKITMTGVSLRCSML